MLISDIGCQCGASYKRAESDTLDGAAGQFRCACCGAVIESWNDHHKRVFRLIVPSDRPHRPQRPGI